MSTFEEWLKANPPPDLLATPPTPARRPHRPAAKLRSWRVSIIRKGGQYLGTVEARDAEAAEAAAVTEFDLGDEQRRRLVLQERN
jgi:hypothetical protein